MHDIQEQEPQTQRLLMALIWLVSGPVLIWLALGSQYIEGLWSVGLAFAGYSLIPFSIAALVAAIHNWPKEREEAAIRKALLWGVGGPLSLLLGFIAISALQEWWDTVPSWAAVIIALLIIVLFVLYEKR